MGLEAISVSTYILQGLNVHVVSDENCRGGLQGIMHNNLSSRVIIALFWLACVFFLKLKELSWREGKKEEGKGKRGRRVQQWESWGRVDEEESHTWNGFLLADLCKCKLQVITTVIKHKPLSPSDCLQAFILSARLPQRWLGPLFTAGFRDTQMCDAIDNLEFPDVRRNTTACELFEPRWALRSPTANCLMKVRLNDF